MASQGALLILRQHPMFAGLPLDILEEIAARASHRRFPAGTQVFREGDRGEVLYGVISGRIRISTASPDGRELTLNLCVPGEIVGEIAFLDGGVRTASGEAVEPTTCFALQRAPFLDLLERRPVIALHLLRLVSERLRYINKQVTDSAFLNVPVRLAQRLAQLPRAACDADTDASSTGNAFEVRISQLDLASFLGVSRQVVNGYLRAWQRDELIEVGRGRIFIRDLEGLLANAGQSRA